MQKSEMASKAKHYRARSVPADVIYGKLAGCCRAVARMSTAVRPRPVPSHMRVALSFLLIPEKSQAIQSFIRFI
jgi:hypothetical protein